MGQTMGRPRVKAPHLAAPQKVVAHTAIRPRLRGACYGGTPRALAVVPGPGPWYRSAEDLVAVRWVFVRDGTGSPRDAYVLTTALTMNPQPLGQWSTPRGSIAPTFQAYGAYLQRESTKGYDQHPVLRSPPACADATPWVGCALFNACAPPELSGPASGEGKRRGRVPLCSRASAGPWGNRGGHTGAAAREVSQLSPACQDTLLSALAPTASRAGEVMSSARIPRQWTV
jgi:hypothetical protein